MNDLDKIGELYLEILSEATSSHTTRKDIAELLDVIYTVNQYYKAANLPEIARIEKKDNGTNIFPNDGSNNFFWFHDAQDKHPVRRAIRNILKNDLENVKRYVDRKFLRQYVQPILTGN
jgi:hypothetical protein